MILLEGNLICIFHSLENHSSRLFPPPPLFFLLSSLFHFLVADRSSSRLALRRKEGGEEKKWALGEKIATRTLLDPRAQTEGRDKESSRANSSILKSLARPFANPSPFFPLTANLGSRGNLFARVNAPPSLPPSSQPASFKPSRSTRLLFLDENSGEVRDENSNQGERLPLSLPRVLIYIYRERDTIISYLQVSDGPVERIVA